MRLRPALAVTVFGWLAATAGSAAAEMYRWVDEKGELHFTSNLNQVPPAYRNRTTAPREDAGSTLNVAPAIDDPAVQTQTDQRLHHLRRGNASRGAPPAKARAPVDEGEANASSAAAAPRKYDRDCQHPGGNGRCKSQLNPDWVRSNQEHPPSGADADD